MIISKSPLIHLFHKDSPQSLERRREEIFTTSLVNPGQVTKLQGVKLRIFTSIEDVESAYRMVMAVSLANDRIDARVIVEALLCSKYSVACPA